MADQGSGTTRLLLMAAPPGVVTISVLLHAPGKTISPRSYLAEIAKNMEVGLKQRLGADVQNKRYLGPPDRVLLAYEAVGKAPSGQRVQATEFWMVLQRKDLSTLDLHVTVSSDDADQIQSVQQVLELPTTFILLED